MSSNFTGDPRHRQPPSSSPDDFDLGWEEDEQLEELPRGVSILPESPSLSRQNLKSDIHGSEATRFGGTPSSPKLFAQQALFPQVNQLRCWRLENGNPAGLGVIDARATEEDFVDQFIGAMPKTGQGTFKFSLRPLTSDGKEIGQEINLDISEFHSALKLHNHAGNSFGNNSSGGSGNINSEMIGLLRESLSIAQQSVVIERDRAAKLLEQMGNERMEVAQNASVAVQSVSERIMEADAKRQEIAKQQEFERNQQMNDNMATFYQTQQNLLAADRERQEKLFQQQAEKERTFNEMILKLQTSTSEKEQERMAKQSEERVNWFQIMMQQEKARQADERERWDRQRQAEKEEHERKMELATKEFERREQIRKDEIREKEKKLESEAKEREAERNRRHERELKEMELATQRDKDYNERMMQIQALNMQTDKKSSFKEMLKEGLEFVTTLGIDPQDAISKIFGGGGDGGTATEIVGAIKEVTTSVSNIFKAKVEGQAMLEATKVQAEAQKEIAKTNPQMLMQSQPNPQQQAQQLLQMYNAGQLTAEQYNNQMIALGFEPEEDSSEEESSEEETVTPNSTATPQPQAPAQNKPKKKKINLHIKAQKAARTAIKKLGEQASNEPEEKWEQLLLAALQDEPAIHHYCKEVSVVYALREAKIAEEIVIKIINLMKNHPFIDDTTNFGI